MRQQRSRYPTETLLGKALGTLATSLAPHNTYPQDPRPGCPLPPSLPPAGSGGLVSLFAPWLLLEVEDLTGGPGVEEREPT